MTDWVKNLRVSWPPLLFPACLTGLVLGLGGFGLWSYHRVSERLATLEQARPIFGECASSLGETPRGARSGRRRLCGHRGSPAASPARVRGPGGGRLRGHRRRGRLEWRARRHNAALSKASSPSPSRGGSVMARKVGSLGLAGVALLSLGLLALYPFGYRLAWNTTPSMTGHLFLLFPSQTFQRGDL